MELIVARGPVQQQQQVPPVDQQPNQEVSAEQVSNVQSSEGSAADMVVSGFIFVCIHGDMVPQKDLPQIWW